MTGRSVPVDEPAVLQGILSSTEALFLDFDGPVCSVFAGIPAHYVANQLRGVLSDGGHVDLPPEVEKTEDPFEVLRYAATLGEAEAIYVESALTAHELEAVSTAEPTNGAHTLIRAWHATGRASAIVSNNSQAAVSAYLNLHDLHDEIDVVVGRSTADPTTLKPSPHMINSALRLTQAPSDRSTLIGDSASDIVAATAAHVTAIGFANKTPKVDTLSGFHPALVITQLPRLTAL
ncbi:HAD hydrolase-like protein [Actinosynnema sp. NPDC023587]|uniref:HAD family hydrolase n=1 Tax=Actinosynnema sp. NPDC023587 TaxID=3154695 RepID=UPI0033C02A3B